MPGSSESGVGFVATDGKPSRSGGFLTMVMTKAEWRRRRRKKRMIQKYVALGLFCLIVLLVMFVLVKIIAAIFVHRDGGIVEKAGNVKVTQSLLSVSRYARPGVRMSSVEKIVIHSNSTLGKTAQEQRDYYESLKTKKNEDERQSMHFIIDLDGKIYQCIPTNEIALAVGGDEKFKSVSIEYCITGKDGSMSAATYESLCKLCATLCKKYKLSEDRVVRHQDINQVPCPFYFMNADAWDQFKSDVKAAKKGKTISVTNAPISNVVDYHTDSQPDNVSEGQENSGEQNGISDAEGS